MGRDSGGQRHRAEMGTPWRYRLAWLVGGNLALALVVGSVGTQPILAEAAQPDMAEVRAAFLTPGLEGTVVRTDTLTSSEPDYDELDPLDESMTNPDVDTP